MSSKVFPSIFVVKHIHRIWHGLFCITRRDRSILPPFAKLKLICTGNQVHKCFITRIFFSRYCTKHFGVKISCVLFNRKCAQVATTMVILSFMKRVYETVTKQAFGELWNTSGTNGNGHQKRYIAWPKHKQKTIYFSVEF